MIKIRNSANSQLVLSAPSPASRPALQPKAKSQQIIVIPQSMLVNGCISATDLQTILDRGDSDSVKSMENRENPKRPMSSSDYGSDSEEAGSVDLQNKPARKRANLDHLSPEEKLMRRKLKNRVAAQNARDKKRAKMEDMEGELERLKSHAKALEAKMAELARQNERLVAENDQLRSNPAEVNVRLGQDESNGLLVGQQPPESAVLTNVSQPQGQGCHQAGGPMDSAISLIKASKLLLNVIKANNNRRRLKKLPIKKRRWPT